MRKYHLLIAASILVLDRWTKWLVLKKIPLWGSITVIPGLFRLTHLENPGAAFDLFAGLSWRMPLLISFSVAVLAVISLVLWKAGKEMNAGTAALSLIFGGALGNLWDRVFQGRVTDFLDFYIGSHHWYPFNVADSAIVIGALLLLYRVLFTSSARPISLSIHKKT